jgi:hypothetical protein
LHMHYAQARPIATGSAGEGATCRHGPPDTGRNPLFLPFQVVVKRAFHPASCRPSINRHLALPADSDKRSRQRFPTASAARTHRGA